MVMFLTRIAPHRVRDRAGWRSALPLGLLGAVAAVMFGFCACGPEPIEPTVDEIIGKFPPPPTGRHAPAVPVDSVDIYIDQSGSMRGFVADPNSRYCSTIDMFIRQLATAQYKISYYGFSSSTVPLFGIQPNQLVDSSFYRGLETPLDERLQALSNPRHRNRISIVFSDLVQSDAYHQQARFIAAFQDAARLRPELRLMAFRSAYSGSYDPESNATAPNITIHEREDGPNGGRPFYALVLSPSRESLERMDRFLRPHMQAAQEFEPTTPPVRIHSIKYSLRMGGEPQWKEFSKGLTALPESISRVGHVGAFREESRTAHRAEPLTLDLLVEEVCPVYRWDQVEVKVLKATKTAGGWLGEPREFPGVLKIEVPADGRQPGARHLVFSAAAPENGSWDVFQCVLTPGDGNLAVPPWVADWSTRDDTRPVNGSRTLGLEDLVQAMVRGTSEHVELLELILKVKRGD